MALSLEYQDWLRELEAPRLPRATLHASTNSIIHSDMSEGPPRDKTTLFLLRFPEYRRTLRLAVFHEESSTGNRFYRGWRWLDVETPATELPRLVIEEIAMVNLRTKHATYYLLRDREAVKEALRAVTDLTAPSGPADNTLEEFDTNPSTDIAVVCCHVPQARLMAHTALTIRPKQPQNTHIHNSHPF